LEARPIVVGIMLTVVQGKEKHNLTLDDHTRVSDVKAHLEPITGVPAKGQRLLVKGKERDDSVVLSSIGVKAGSKVMLLFTKEYQARAFSRPAVSNKDSTDTGFSEGSGGPLAEQHTIPAIVEITVGGEGESPYAVLMIKSGSKEHAGRYHVKCMNGNVTIQDVKEAIGRTTGVKPQYMRLLAKGRQ
ncbi:hypothetical protein FOZ63_012150, partial [Perkinsus olseni]